VSIIRALVPGYPASFSPPPRLTVFSFFIARVAQNAPLTRSLKSLAQLHRAAPEKRRGIGIEPKNPPLTRRYATKREVLIVQMNPAFFFSLSGGYANSRRDPRDDASKQHLPGRCRPPGAPRPAHSSHAHVAQKP
jgi:hypothetical protein